MPELSTAIPAIRVAVDLLARAAKRHDLTLSALLVLIGSASSLTLLGFWQVHRGEPFRIRSDHMFLLTFIQNSIRGGDLWSIDWLGYPLGQSQLLYPSFDLSYKFLILILTFFSSNAFVVLYWFYFVSICLVCLSAFASLRFIGINRALSFIGSVCFATSPFLALRFTLHDFLALYYSVPLGMAIAFAIYDLNSWQSVRVILSSWFIIISICIVGTSGLYYAFFSAAAIMLIGATATINRQHLGPITAAAATVLPIGVLLLLSGYGPHLLEILHSGIAQPRRLAYEQFNLGLQIAESLHAYADIGLFKSAFTEYLNALPHLYGSNRLFEWPGAVFTSVILISPIAVFCAPLLYRSSAPGLPGTTIWLAFCLTAACLIFSTRGGLGYIFNVLVVPYIRATARVMPVLTFLAILIFCAGTQVVTHYITPWARLLVRTALGVLAVASLYPYFGQIARYQRDGFSEAAGERAVFESVQHALSAIHRAKVSTVLQLPYAAWPEAAMVEGLDPYQHALLFVMEKPEWSTKWSFGASFLDPRFQANKAFLQPEKPNGLIDRARNLHFDSVLIEKRGYSTKELTDIMNTIRRESACQIYEDPIRVIVAIDNKNCLP